VDLRVQPPLPDVVEIVRNLRERDRAEIFACQFGDDPVGFGQQVCAAGAFQWGAYIDGRPVAIIGAMPRWPRVWSMFAFGTDEWDKVVLTLTKHARRFILPALYRSGAHRLECAALEAHEDARKWITFLGGQEETRLANYGKNGECFVGFVWMRDDIARAIAPRKPTVRIR
jgi:hypothetical protein